MSSSDEEEMEGEEFQYDEHEEGGEEEEDFEEFEGQEVEGEGGDEEEETDTGNGSNDNDNGNGNGNGNGGKSLQDLEKQKAARKEQREKLLERKNQKPNSDLIVEAKKIWEELRQKRHTKEERRALMDSMMKLVTGKALDIIYKHDASRIVQCCVKYGSPTQRDQVAKELSGHYARLSCSKYGRFIVSKVLQYCSPKWRNAVIVDFYGRVRRLIRHKEASLVLDEAYSQFANAAQRNRLMEEFYGPEFAVFKSTENTSTSLQDLLVQHPLKKPSILKYIRQTIDSVLEKSSFNVGKTPILHRAIIDYLSVAEPSACKDMIELLKDHLVHMLHTRDGARVAQYCILHSGPKDRKHIIKTFKGFVHSIAKEQYGHAVLLTCFECIDDTVLVGKALIGELFTPPTQEQKMNELLRDQYASRVFLFLLCGRNKKFQPSYVVMELEATDATRAETTKKEPEARQQQLLEVASPLLAVQVALYADELFRDKAGSTLLIETCNNALGDDANQVVSAVIEALAKGADGEIAAPAALDGEEIVNVVKKLKAERDAQKKKDQGLNMEESLLIGRASTFAIKSLLMKPKDGAICPTWKAKFITKVWETLSPHLPKLLDHCASYPGSTAGLAFILVALFENGTAEIQGAMKAATKKNLKKITEKAKSSEAVVASPVVSAGKKRKTPDVPKEERKTGLNILLNLLS